MRAETKTVTELVEVPSFGLCRGEAKDIKGPDIDGDSVKVCASRVQLPSQRVKPICRQVLSKRSEAQGLCKSIPPQGHPVGVQPIEASFLYVSKL